MVRSCCRKARGALGQLLKAFANAVEMFNLTEDCI